MAPTVSHDPLLGERGEDARDRAAQALLTLVAAEHPPVHLYLGEDALQLVADQMTALQAEITAWEDVSRSTSFR